VTVIVPAVVAVYYTNSAISTAQTITFKTASGSGVGIDQGARIIALCDGTNVLSAQSAVANSSLSLTDGTVVNPSLYFATQTNTGLFKYGVNGIGLAVNGVDVFHLTPTAAFINGLPATSVVNTPAGNISATTVQAAINELDTEKQPYSANLDEYAAVNPSAAGLALLDDADAAAQRATLGLVIGTNVQPYDADTAKTDVAQTFTAVQKTTPATDNDLSFDLSAAQDFVCTPSSGGTLTFTNISAGVKGEIILINGSNYTIAKAAAVKCPASMLATISATGRYRLAYSSLDGTNVDVTSSSALS